MTTDELFETQFQIELQKKELDWRRLTLRDVSYQFIVAIGQENPEIVWTNVIKVRNNNHYETRYKRTRIGQSLKRETMKLAKYCGVWSLDALNELSAVTSVERKGNGRVSFEVLSKAEYVAKQRYWLTDDPDF